MLNVFTSLKLNQRFKELKSSISLVYAKLFRIIKPCVEAGDTHDYNDHARPFLDGTHTFKGTLDQTSHSSGLPYSFVLPDKKSELAGPLHDTVSKLDDEVYKRYKIPIGQHTETRFKAQQKLDSFLLEPGFSSISSKHIEKYRLSITKAHRDLIELYLPNLADFMLYVFAHNRIPEVLKEEFQKTLEPHQVPTLQQLLDFLFERETELEAVEGTDKRVLPNTATDFKPRALDRSSSGSSFSKSCERPCHICCEAHSMRHCPTFLTFTVAERRSYMETYDHICRNCFAQSHRTSDCKSLACCKICSKRHHDMLHPEPRQLYHNLQSGGMSLDREKSLSDIKREIGLFRCGEYPSSVSSSDGFLHSSPSSDS